MDCRGPNNAANAHLVTDGDVNTLFVHKMASLGTLKNVRNPNNHRGPSTKPLPRRRHEPNCEHWIIQQYRKAKSLKKY